MGVNEVAQRCDVCRTEYISQFILFMMCCLTVVHRLDRNNKSSASTTRCQECDAQLAAEKRRKSGRVGSNLPPSSAKIRKIMEILEAIDERSDGKEKTIIFSQFTSMLDLLEPFLREDGFKYTRCRYTLCIAISPVYVLMQRR
jgi:SNF2 family DNA or RNA helicase